MVQINNKENTNCEDRFVVVYGIKATSYEDAKAQIWAVQIEQTIEFPYEFVEDEWIKNEVVGRLENLVEVDGEYEARISYLSELASGEITQFLNVVLGNASLYPGIWVKKIELSNYLANIFSGPRFGLQGIRALLDVPEGPMLQAVVKPMGLSAKELAKMCSAYALGGADVIKDDHGLTNQVFAPFSERVKRCAAAVQEANAKTGRKTLYAANVTADGMGTFERAYEAKELGATALMVAPGLVGFDTLRALSQDDKLGLPIISHPSFSGGFLMPGISGIKERVWFGFLNRMCGSDMSIFVSYGGRFTFTKEQCGQITEELLKPQYGWKSSCPAPGGGMTAARLPELLELYGKDIMFLVGGDMFRRGRDLEANAKYFLSILRPR